MRLLVERDVNGWGVEAVGTDAGLDAGFDPPFPAHALTHGSNRFGLASLANLDQLTPADRSAADHRAAQDRGRIRQSAAGAGARPRRARVTPRAATERYPDGLVAGGLDGAHAAHAGLLRTIARR